MVRELVEMHGFNLSVLTDKWTGRKPLCSETCCSALSVCLTDTERHEKKKKRQRWKEGRNLYEFTVVMLLAAK